jgi:hypothetical protein
MSLNPHVRENVKITIKCIVNLTADTPTKVTKPTFHQTTHHIKIRKFSNAGFNKLQKTPDSNWLSNLQKHLNAAASLQPLNLQPNSSLNTQSQQKSSTSRLQAYYLCFSIILFLTSQLILIFSICSQLPTILFYRKLHPKNK